MTEDPQDPTQEQSEPQPEPEVAPETPTPDSGLQTPLPDQPIETPQPDEQPVQHSDEPAPDSQRAQRLDTANRISSLGANQVSEHERKQAELDEARRVHNEKARTPFDS